MQTDSRITSSADQLVASTARMRQALEHLGHEAAEREPDDNGWTPAQIVYHVALTNERFFIPAFDGSAAFMAPAPEAFTETFSFGSIPAKIKTFPQLEPPKVGTRDALEKLDDTAGRLAELMRRFPADRLTDCAALPFGTLSIQQMAEFAAGHVARHQAQLDRAIAGV